MSTLEDKALWDAVEGIEDLDQEILQMSNEDIKARTRAIDNEIKVRAWLRA